MAREPLFAVGEPVILVSESYPEYNGEYTIVDMKYGVYTVVDGTEFTGWGYNLGFIAECGSCWWLETTLRKKHKPSEFGSFTNLMNNLKLPQKTPQEVK